MSPITVSHPSKNGSDLSASAGLVAQYNSGASLASSGTIAAQDIIGVILSGNTSGETNTIAVFGRCKALAGDTLTPGTHRFLTVDATSRLIPATAGKIIVAEWIGQQGGAAAAGDQVEVFVSKSYYVLDT